jgi:hypothetical protein
MPTPSRIVIAVKTLVFVLVVLAAAVDGQDDLFPGMPIPAEVTVKLGKHQELLPNGTGGLIHFPDEPICILKRNPLVFTMVAGDGTYLMQGKTLQSALPLRRILAPGPAGSIDNNYAGIAAMYHDKPRKRWIGLYHAEDKEGIGMIELTAVNGFYGTIAAVEMSEDGTSTKKLGAAITADLPKLPRGWEQHGGPPAAWLAQGVCTPTVTESNDGKYLYCWYAEYSNRVKGNTSRGVQICVARSTIGEAGVPGSWTKYHKGEFSQPGLGGHETPIVNAGSTAEAMDPHVTYVEKWGMYVMVFGVGCYADIHAKPPKAVRSGLFLTTSRDAVHWASPVLMETVFPLVIVTQECKVHPMLMVNRVTDTTLTGVLTYGYTPEWPKVPHHMGGCPITITKLPAKERDTVAPSMLADRLKGTKWIRDGQPNNVFEWTNDGRLLQNGGDRKWKVLDDKSAEVRVGERVDRWVFADDLKTVVQHGDGGKWKSTWVRAD